MLQGKNSHFTAYTPEIKEGLEEITVEFWFNPILNVEANQFIFAMKEERTLKREFF